MFFWCALLAVALGLCGCAAASHDSVDESLARMPAANDRPASPESLDAPDGEVPGEETPPPPPQPSVQGVVCIDAGHGAIPDATLEPIGPGSSEMRPREPGGTSGATTGIPEYQVVLNVALKLQRELEAQGITVVMVRTENNVNISSIERAAVANGCNADLFIRLHCDGSTNPGVYGFTTLVPGYNGWTAPIVAESAKAAQVMHPLIVAQTGAKDNGTVERNDLAGFNYSAVPALLFEMGYMSNAEEEQRLISDAYQELLAKSISTATIAYLSQKG